MISQVLLFVFTSMDPGRPKIGQRGAPSLSIFGFRPEVFSNILNEWHKFRRMLDEGLFIVVSFPTQRRDACQPSLS